MLERIVVDVLVRVLGSYVDGLNSESVKLGVWAGDLELRDLRLKADALAVLFETLGLDLPVTVTAGHVGLLRLEVPWKRLRSSPVRIVMRDMNVVASPVSDGDQLALGIREKRLRAARLATDEAVRDARFSLRGANGDSGSSDDFSESGPSNIGNPSSVSQKTSFASRIGRMDWWRSIFTRIVDNLQVEIENVIIQYEDSSSVRDSPYTCSLGIDSLKACSTDAEWRKVFLDDSSFPLVHKVVSLEGLCLNWEPGNDLNRLKRWILDADAPRSPGYWAGFVRSCKRHAIKPLNAELRIALVKASALANALSSPDSSNAWVLDRPRVEMDLHIPNVDICLDDFTYHTLLSTIMYLSDIDRRVRPRTARGRWHWALDRLLPRFKERRDASLRLNAKSLREMREVRIKYCRARNSVVSARRQGLVENEDDAKLVEEIESCFPYEQILAFRDVADKELLSAVQSTSSTSSTNSANSSRFWSMLPLWRRSQGQSVSVATANPTDSSDLTESPAHQHSPNTEGRNEPSGNPASRAEQQVAAADQGNFYQNERQSLTNPVEKAEGLEPKSRTFCNSEISKENGDSVPSFRMAFLMERGAICLSEGGYPGLPNPVSSLEFRELRLGIATSPRRGFLLEALLGTFEVFDLVTKKRVMYPRGHCHGGQDDTLACVESDQKAPIFSESSGDAHLCDDPESFASSENAETVVSGEFLVSGDGANPVKGEDFPSASMRSYPHEVTSALSSIRGDISHLNSTDLSASVSSSSRDPAGRHKTRSYAASASTEKDGKPKPSVSGQKSQSNEYFTKYIAALRLKKENTQDDSEWGIEASRLSMNLAIGGMEVYVDGPNGAFVSSVRFWSPREKLPSIMEFLSRSAAPRLASLRMDIQRAILGHKAPMLMDLYIQGPRFVVPVHPADGKSLIFDLGTFEMTTSVGSSQHLWLCGNLNYAVITNSNIRGNDGVTLKMEKCIPIQYTNYCMTFSDLGVFIVHDNGRQHSERVVRPFSVNLLLQVLNNSSFVEAMTLHLDKAPVAKCRLSVVLRSLKTTISHRTFRLLLEVARGWKLAGADKDSGREVGEDLGYQDAHRSRNIQGTDAQFPISSAEKERKSSLIFFDMRLDIEDMQLELRDMSLRRVVTVSSTGTMITFKRFWSDIDLAYKVRTFIVTDGSRGATAPYRRLVYAGLEGNQQAMENNEGDPDLSTRVSGETIDIQERCQDAGSTAFISVFYRGNLADREQEIELKVLSLNVVCVRETYLALVDFFYFVESPSKSSLLKNEQSTASSVFTGSKFPEGTEDWMKETGNYSDPFNALGMTTSTAARKLRDTANIGMELSKQALANRGKLSLTANLDGISVVLVTAEGAIASFEITNCASRLEQYPNGAVKASGEFGAFGVKDLTASYDVYSKAIHYTRMEQKVESSNAVNVEDGWTLNIPEKGTGDTWLCACLRNVDIVYLQRFVIILKKYFDVLRDNLQPVLDMKGSIAEVFDDDEIEDDFLALEAYDSRLRLDIVTEDINVIMPRHSQSPHEALRFIVKRSAITNEDHAAPGYKIGVQITADGVDGFVLYNVDEEPDDVARSMNSSPRIREIDPHANEQNLAAFANDIFITSKIDLWRKRRVPQVSLNEEGIPVLKDHESEREYDPAKWRPAIRIRICAPNGLEATLCEAQYSILYFTFTENVIERPDIEFTDIVRGLKTPILPPRRPIRPITLSSHRMPPNYQIRFEVPRIYSTIMYGGNPCDESAKLISSELRDLVGSFEYGVDYRMSVEVSANMHSVVDIRPHAVRPNAIVISSKSKIGAPSDLCEAGPQRSRMSSDFHKPVHMSSITEVQETRSLTLTWDRPFGFGANVMVVVSDLRIIVVPELFRDLGLLTGPGFPYLTSSAPAPFLRFNGRLLIVTLSNPEVWLMAHQFEQDERALVLRGDIIAKVKWAAVTGRNTVEVAAHGLHLNLSSVGPEGYSDVFDPSSPSATVKEINRNIEKEVPLLYRSGISLKHQGSGYDPPESPSGHPTKAPGSELNLEAESVLLRVDVNDIPLILAVGSRLGRLKPSFLSQRPAKPGRFDEWIDKSEDGDTRLILTFGLPHARLIFTDAVAGHYIPIMELRFRNAFIQSNIPWMTSAKFEFSIDLFNEEKGWWEPGIEPFSFELAASRGRSGSQAIQVRADEAVDVNITPTTLSGAFCVAKTLKSAIEDLIENLRMNNSTKLDNGPFPLRFNGRGDVFNAPRPSVAAFCVKNDTGRPILLWLPYDSSRKSLHGDGGEYEVEMPTEDLLWSTSAHNYSRVDANRDRHLFMKCIVCLTGYEPLSLSCAEVGSHLVEFFPEIEDTHPQNNGYPGAKAPLSLVWEITMRNGVPLGCLRSAFRIVNRTRTVYEIKIGFVSLSSDRSVKPVETMDNENSGRIPRGESSDDKDPGITILKAGESWALPLYALKRSIRLRPALFHAPESEERDESHNINSFAPNPSRVLYSYHWSDPLSRFAALLETAQRLNACAEDFRLASKSSEIPTLTCRASNDGHPFCTFVYPRVRHPERSRISPSLGQGAVWLDVHLCAPIVITNTLPRPLSFALASQKSIPISDKQALVAKGWLEPRRSIDIHTAGVDLSRLCFGLGYDNIPAQAPKVLAPGLQSETRTIKGMHKNLATIQKIPIGDSIRSSFDAKIDMSFSDSSHSVTIYCDFWIRNRSNVSLSFRSAKTMRDIQSGNCQECLLNPSPPSAPAERYVAFSGPFLGFSIGGRDEWHVLGSEIHELDAPIYLELKHVSLVADVRQAKAEFHRSAIVTIQNAVWIENRTECSVQWCQPAALNPHGITLSSNVHSVTAGHRVPLHWDFDSNLKAVCLRKVEESDPSEWIWSRPIAVDSGEGEFAAKMYRPKRHEQYIARVVVSKICRGVSLITVHREDRSTPPYRIVNLCARRSVAFRQSGIEESNPWLVRPGKATRYSWDDPQAPLRRRSLVIEIIEEVPTRSLPGVPRSHSTTAVAQAGLEHGANVFEDYRTKKAHSSKEIRYPKFHLNIDIIRSRVDFSQQRRFKPPLIISVQVDGPTKVVTFADEQQADTDPKKSPQIRRTSGVEKQVLKHESLLNDVPTIDGDEGLEVVSKNIDIEVWIKSLGVSFVEDSPSELAYLSVWGVHLRMDRFDDQQLVVGEIRDLQLDNQLPQCAWPVVLWSPPAHIPGRSVKDLSTKTSERVSNVRKPFFQLTLDGPFPHVKNGISSFRGVFVAVQQLQIAVDEDFVLRVWIFAQSLIDATGLSSKSNREILYGNDELYNKFAQTPDEVRSRTRDSYSDLENPSMARLYVENLELCPLKITVSFTSSRTSAAAVRVSGFRSLMRTLLAVLGNVENAEFRFNALELRHVFDSVTHFRSLITEFYMSQGSNQKIALLTSNSLIGNPSALFDSIAIGAKDFFIEPSKAKGSADFIAGIGRGSSSLITNTVGGIVGSLGGIPRAMAHGFETAVGDKDYLAERESIRGGRARSAASPAQGLYTGALSFGHGIASGAAGLIRDPFQGAVADGPSGFVKGLRKGVIGGVLKPITGALDLIAEPAAGFRSLMVSERNKSFAEPVRPPRTFRGTNEDRLVSYDLRSSLGAAILHTVVQRENDQGTDRLLAWVELIANNPTLSGEEIVEALWHLVRRGTRASFGNSGLHGPHGIPDRVEKIRVGLVTSRRLIVTALDGKIVSQYPLTDILDMRTSLQSRDYLSIGVRPPGHRGGAVAPLWHRIHCGSVSSRDALNSALNKVLSEFGKGRAMQNALVGDLHTHSLTSSASGTNSIEMTDLSSPCFRGSKEINSRMGAETEMKILHRDASVDGRRGVFTQMSLPGRTLADSKSGGGIQQSTSFGSIDALGCLNHSSDALSQQVMQELRHSCPRLVTTHRSVRLLFVNRLAEELALVRSSIESGKWVNEIPQKLEQGTISVVEAHCTASQIRDLSGSLVFKVALSTETSVSDESDTNNTILFRFINPMLASNAYAVASPSDIIVSHVGGERGDHPQIVVQMSRAPSELEAPRHSVSKTRLTLSAEPLLFGRSHVPSSLTKNARPPHSKKPPAADPNDPALIGKLASLGFSEKEAHQSLIMAKGDLSKAYSFLAERKR